MAQSTGHVQSHQHDHSPLRVPPLLPVLHAVFLAAGPSPGFAPVQTCPILDTVWQISDMDTGMDSAPVVLGRNCLQLLAFLVTSARVPAPSQQYIRYPTAPLRLHGNHERVPPQPPQLRPQPQHAILHSRQQRVAVFAPGTGAAHENDVHRLQARGAKQQRQQGGADGARAQPVLRAAVTRQAQGEAVQVGQVGQAGQQRQGCGVQLAL